MGFARVKNKKSIWRAKPQSRQGLRKSNQSDHNFFAPAFRPPTVGRQAGLCALPAAVGFARKKKKNMSRKVGKPQRIGNYSFAPLRLCEKKKISLPAMLQSSPLNSTRKRWELMAIFEINWNREKAMNVDFLYLKIEAYLRNEA